MSLRRLVALRQDVSQRFVIVPIKQSLESKRTDKRSRRFILQFHFFRSERYGAKSLPAPPTRSAGRYQVKFLPRKPLTGAKPRFDFLIGKQWLRRVKQFSSSACIIYDQFVICQLGMRGDSAAKTPFPL